MVALKVDDDEDRWGASRQLGVQTRPQSVRAIPSLRLMSRRGLTARGRDYAHAGASRLGQHLER